MEQTAGEQAQMAAGMAGQAAEWETEGRAVKRTAGARAAGRTAKRETGAGPAHGTARRTERIAAAEEILEYLTDVMREGDTKDGFHAAELLGKHYSLFSESTRGDGTAVTIINDVER